MKLEKRGEDYAQNLSGRPIRVAKQSLEADVEDATDAGSHAKITVVELHFVF